MFFRWILGLPFAAIVTTALFFFMAGMIDRDMPIEPIKQTPALELLVKTKDSTLDPKPDIEPPILTEDPPEPIIETTPPGPKPDPTPGVPTKRIEDPTRQAGPNLIIAPIIRYKPQYPESCRARGAEGDVLVQFDVTPEGRVVNVRIIESADPCFNRTVRSTVAKWKYPPAIEDGRATMRYGVLERFSFQLEE